MVPGPHLTATSAHWRAVASLPVLPAAEGPLKASAFPHSPCFHRPSFVFSGHFLSSSLNQGHSRAERSQCFQEPLILVRGSHSALSATATAPSLGGLADSRKPTSQPREATAGTGWAFLDPQRKAQKLQLLFLNDTAARQKLFNAAARVSPPPSRLLSRGARGSRVGSTRRAHSPHSLGPATKAKGGHTYAFCVYVCLSSTLPSVRLVGSYRVPDPAECVADGLSRFEHRGPRWSLSVAGPPRVSPSRGMGVSGSPPTLVKRPSEGRGSASRAMGRRGFPRI